MAVQPIAVNDSTKLYEVFGTVRIYRLTGLNVNQTNTDIGTFANLPAKYIVRRVTFDNASATPTASTVSLRTASGGGGTAIVNAQALASLTAATTLVDVTIATTTTVFTASSLFVRAVVAAGSASTVDCTLVIDVLTP